MKISRVINYIFYRAMSILRNVNMINVSPESFIHRKAFLQGVNITGKVNIGYGTKILNSVTIKGGALISIGNYTSLNGPSTDIRSMINPVVIGSFTSIARGVAIQEFNHRFDTLSTYHINSNLFKADRTDDIYSNGAIEIGSDVWVGAQCVILSGSKIGDGAIVAANSVVSGEVPPYAIVAGSPAKVVKYRFDGVNIQYLQNLKWWEWPLERIIIHKELFRGKLNMELIKEIEPYE